MRRCTTVPGYGTCCAAAQQGALGRPFKLQTAHGTQRCARCDQITKRNGSPGFRFRWVKNNVCGIGPGGCPALLGGGQAQITSGSPVLQIPSFGG
jgi:hypothetical protein